MTVIHKTRISEYILANQADIIEGCLYSLKKINIVFPDTNSTLSTTKAELNRYSNHSGYKLYNLFAVAAPNAAFFDLFQELVDFIFSSCQEDKLYVQAWLNCQPNEELLDWHRHSGYLLHGYICIDPKDTLTEFETFEIENKIGLMYVGECGEQHRVVSRNNFEGFRLTIGFDAIRPSEMQFDNMGFIPISRRK